MFRWVWRVLVIGWALIARFEGQASDVPSANRAPMATGWACQPLVRPALPLDRLGTTAVLRTPVDAYVQARLETVELPRSREAERPTLLRRLSLDLTGLPPTAAEVAAFVEDPHPHAYERQVERLLASPAFGERWAAAWLEWVRFAWPPGPGADLGSGLMPYRDWVIAAFNANQPFDLFTRDQLAGDLLAEPTLAQRVATGFLQRPTPFSEAVGESGEGAAWDEADLARLVSAVWLGVPMGCAACHDHPPVRRGDFEGLKAFFADTRSPALPGREHGIAEEGMEEGSGIRILVESPPLQRSLAAALAEEKAAYQAASEALLQGPQQARDDFRRWRQELNEFLEAYPDGWRIPRLNEAQALDGNTGDGRREPRAEVQIDGSIRLGSGEVTDDQLVFELPEGWVAAVRLELLPVSPGRSAFRDDRRQTLVQMTAAVRRKEANQVEALPFWFAESETGVAGRVPDDGEVSGVVSGWRTSPERAGARQVSVWLLEEPRRFAAGDQLILELPGNASARLRVGTSPLSPDRGRWSALTAAIWTALGQDRGLWQPVVHEAYHRSTDWDADLSRRLRELDRWIRECRGGRAWARVNATGAARPPAPPSREAGGVNGRPAGHLAGPAFPSFLPPPRRPVEAEGEARPQPWNRLDLARWLASSDNPLTARCLVNRFWAMLFGRGLATDSEDLGSAASGPSHPELLDWLAAEFRQPTLVASPLDSVPPPQAWDLKHLVRLLVNSAAYRASSNPSARAREMDPENRLFSHQSWRPLPALFVSDYGLALVNRLDGEVGGPWSLRLSSGSGAEGADRRTAEVGNGWGAWRRALYRRGARPLPSVLRGRFLASSAAECQEARRALPGSVEVRDAEDEAALRTASVALALEVLKTVADDDLARIAYLLQRVRLRKPVDTEVAVALAVLTDQRGVVATDPDLAPTWLRSEPAGLPDGIGLEALAAWAGTTRTLLGWPRTTGLD